MQNPDELKIAAPWPKQDPDSVKRLRALSEAEIQANGWGSPPYHPLCRGQLVPTGTVREVVEGIPLSGPYPAPSSLLLSGSPGSDCPTLDTITRDLIWINASA